MKKKLAKSQYRFKKQWESIISSLLIPDNIPLTFAKSITINLENGDNIIAYSKKDFTKKLEVITESEINISDMFIEIDYQKLINLVERHLNKLIN